MKKAPSLCCTLCQSTEGHESVVSGKYCFKTSGQFGTDFPLLAKYCIDTLNPASSMHP